MIRLSPMWLRPAVSAGVVALFLLFAVPHSEGVPGHPPAPAPRPSLSAAPSSGSGRPIVVFAPHPDDETLGAGGLIHEARQRGAEVRLVFITSGDGFTFAAAESSRRWPGYGAMRRLAERRRDEARQAAACLGVPPAALTFLGYPDRGLAPMWLSFWSADRPFRSPYTGECIVGMADALRPGAPFCGAAVLRDVERLLDRLRPAAVYFPDAGDDHPDHWAAYCFVRLARERLRSRPWAASAAWRTYLVHRGSWPRPLAAAPQLNQRPPRDLAGRGWESVALSPAAIAAKRAALDAHRSQQRLAGGFLAAFVRRSELFRPCEPTVVLAGARATVFPEAVSDRWDRLGLGAADFTGLQVTPEADSLKLTAQLRAPLGAWVDYRVYWKPVDGARERAATHVAELHDYRCDAPGIRFALDGRRINIWIPHLAASGGRLMIAAEAWAGPVLLDRTAWHVVAADQNNSRIGSPPSCTMGSGRPVWSR